MLGKRDFFKHLTDKKFKEKYPVLKLADVVNKRLAQSQSKYPLRLLGRTEDGRLYISEEERAVNYHIIGAPGEGKSKFIVYNAIEDIKLGHGICVLDPTSNGSTAQEILQFCASKGVEKVCYIDHATLYGQKKVATIRPLWGNESDEVIYPDKASVDGVMETIQILFNISRLTETSRMKLRLEALFRSLIRNKGTLYETKYFSRYNDPRKFDFLGADDDSELLLEEFKTPNLYKQYFSSTVNALGPFQQEPLSLMLSSDTGIDFKKMLREKWVILVNLCPAGNFNFFDSQLLGVLIISQIIQAADTLNRNNWKGRHYLYIDEAGRFATKQVDDILASRRHIGLSLIIAHQFFKQFENERVLESISQNTGVKVMFNVRESVDRLRMMKSLGYGGQITPDMASYANQNLPKQYAIIRKNKETPIKIRTPDVHVPTKDIDSYIAKLLEQPWYKTRFQIKTEINARLTSKPLKGAKNTKYGKAPNNQSAHKGDVSTGVRTTTGALEKPSLPTGIKKPAKPSKPEGSGF